MSVARQWLCLAGGALVLQLRHALQVANGFLFGLRAQSLFWLMAPPVWLITVLLPTSAQAWRFCHLAARALLRLAGVPLHVQGLAHLRAEGRCVLVCNHASYLDGLVLLAALSRPHTFVAKRELAQQWVTGQFLRRLGAAFVDRFDARRSVADAQRMAEVVQTGQSLLVFPEGTFAARPGLLPFRLGGFLAAAQANAPLVPVTLIGTRQLLGDGRWWPQRAALSVHIGTPLSTPQTVDIFAAAVQLRDQARSVISTGLAASEF